MKGVYLHRPHSYLVWVLNVVIYHCNICHVDVCIHNFLVPSLSVFRWRLCCPLLWLCWMEVTQRGREWWMLACSDGEEITRVISGREAGKFWTVSRFHHKIYVYKFCVSLHFLLQPCRVRLASWWWSQYVRRSSTRISSSISGTNFVAIVASHLISFPLWISQVLRLNCGCGWAFQLFAANN